MKKAKLRFTGERMIPSHDIGRGVYYEHIARYMFASQIARQKTVFDIACGSGYGCHILGYHGKAKKVVGVDRSISAIQYAKDTYGMRNVVFMVRDIEKNFDLNAGAPDLITAFEVIEHVVDQDRLIRNTSRILKPNGICLFSTPNNFNCPYENRFHTKQLYPREFTRMLQRHYRYVTLFHQTFEFSQVIGEVNQPKVTLVNDSYIKNTYITYLPDLKEQSTQSLLAVCSQRSLPHFHSLMINSKRLDGFDMSKGTLSLNLQSKAVLEENARLKNTLNEITKSKFFYFWPAYQMTRDIFREFRKTIN